MQISDAWYLAIERGTVNPEQHLKSLDLLILFHLHDLPNKRKPVESLIKNRIRSGKVTEELIRKCFKVFLIFVIFLECIPSYIGNALMVHDFSYLFLQVILSQDIT